MKTILLAITAALAVYSAMNFMSQDQASPRFLAKEDPIKSAWSLWKKTEGRSYGNDSEESYRFQVFTVNYNTITDFNSRPQTSTVTLNKFADLSKEEFKAQYTGLKTKKMTAAKPTRYYNTANIVDSYDARDDNLVNAVKDQGQCGSCWAFSAVAAVEMERAKQGLGLESFSEQMVVDCTPAPQEGCNGGYMDRALEWIVDNPLAHENDYQYTASNGTCVSGSTDNKTGAISSSSAVSASESSIRAAILAHGGVSVGIEADESAFQFYSGGVITNGCHENIDHGVAAIGFGTENGSTYFLVRNSWGASWGDHGYVKMAPNQCGVMTQVVVAHAEF